MKSHRCSEHKKEAMIRPRENIAVSCFKNTTFDFVDTLVKTEKQIAKYKYGIYE